MSHEIASFVPLSTSLLVNLMRHLFAVKCLHFFIPFRRTRTMQNVL